VQAVVEAAAMAAAEAVAMVAEEAEDIAVEGEVTAVAVAEEDMAVVVVDSVRTHCTLPSWACLYCHHLALLSSPTHLISCLDRRWRRSRWLWRWRRRTR
jgi:hypothetical protein